MLAVSETLDRISLGGTDLGFEFCQNLAQKLHFVRDSTLAEKNLS